jgi:hypothetical protein
MRISQNTVGWGLVAFCAGIVMLVALREQPIASKVTLAFMVQAHINSLVTEGEITHTESVIMRQDEYDAWRGVSPLAGYLEDGAIPIYVYRAYGDIKQAMLFGGAGSSNREYQALEIALDARTGQWLGTISAIPWSVTPRDLQAIPTVDPDEPRFPPPTMVQLPSQATALPEITAEALP